MEPAQTIIQAFGGEEKVAEITGTSYTAPYRWQHPRDKGGTGGLIPQKQAMKLLAYAREHGVSVSAADFLAPDAPEISRHAAGMAA
ncbi:hypothetical protein [Lichenihabitans psoromatis]|uniref:hypothetical protein n=1 Tax=Lichenihabitans psoromatis TaxID=2528642 RepID=UPI001038349B|nr:hypothetical protein [Lichenihabitans psoromatis]